jgi:hypothetical protein
MVEDLEDDAKGAADRADGPVSALPEPVLLIGVPVRDALDTLALQLLGVLLRDSRCVLEILPADTLIGERIAEVEARQPAAVCVASLPGELTTTRHVCKRLRARLPGLPIVVGRLLSSRKAPERSGQLLKSAGAEHVASTLEEFRDLLRQVVRNARPATQPEAVPQNASLAAAR